MQPDELLDDEALFSETDLTEVEVYIKPTPTEDNIFKPSAKDDLFYIDVVYGFLKPECLVTGLQFLTGVVNVSGIFHVATKVSQPLNPPLPISVICVDAEQLDDEGWEKHDNINIVAMQRLGWVLGFRKEFGDVAVGYNSRLNLRRGFLCNATRIYEQIRRSKNVA